MIMSQTVMDFKDQYGEEKVSVMLPRRSILVMSGESRLKWTHGSELQCKPYNYIAAVPVTMVTTDLSQLFVWTSCSTYTHEHIHTLYIHQLHGSNCNIFPVQLLNILFWLSIAFTLTVIVQKPLANRQEGRLTVDYLYRQIFAMASYRYSVDNVFCVQQLAGYIVSQVFSYITSLCLICMTTAQLHVCRGFLVPLYLHFTKLSSFLKQNQ